jgi:hypothetical protein
MLQGESGVTVKHRGPGPRLLRPGSVCCQITSTDSAWQAALPRRLRLILTRWLLSFLQMLLLLDVSLF